MEYGQTAYNRTVYASGAVAPSGYEKPQSAYGLCAVFLCHILARRKPSVCFMGGPKRHIQPERYAPFALKICKNILTKIILCDKLFTLLRSLPMKEMFNIKNWVISSLIITFFIIITFSCVTDYSGNSWVSTSEMTYKLGDTGPAGGIIFHAYNSGPMGMLGWYYLEAAPAETEIELPFGEIFVNDTFSRSEGRSNTKKYMDEIEKKEVELIRLFGIAVNLQ
jgi:hypothetical protein